MTNLLTAPAFLLATSVLVLNSLVAHTQVINLIPDTHKVVAKHVLLDNQMVALGNRLIAHYRSAQEWEGINAQNPEAIALREKIEKEEKEFFAKAREYKQLPPEKEIVRKCEKECSDSEKAGLIRSMKDFNETEDGWKVQSDRYHALGY